METIVGRRATKRAVLTHVQFNVVLRDPAEIRRAKPFKPRRARSMAVDEPAQRAPTMIASYIAALRVTRHVI
jgi:hypothetical protein